MMDSIAEAFIGFVENRIKAACTNDSDVMKKLEDAVDWRMHDDVVTHVCEETMRAYKQGLRDGAALTRELLGQ